jgi:hypothetical protein
MHSQYTCQHSDTSDATQTFSSLSSSVWNTFRGSFSYLQVSVQSVIKSHSQRRRQHSVNGNRIIPFTMMMPTRTLTTQQHKHPTTTPPPQQKLCERAIVKWQQPVQAVRVPPAVARRRHRATQQRYTQHVTRLSPSMQSSAYAAPAAPLLTNTCNHPGRKIRRKAVSYLWLLQTKALYKRIATLDQTERYLSRAHGTSSTTKSHTVRSHAPLCRRHLRVAAVQGRRPHTSLAQAD